MSRHQKQPMLQGNNLKIIAAITIVFIVLIGFICIGNDSFNAKTAKYGFDTEEGRNFLCISIGTLNPELEIRLNAALTAVAYSRYLQEKELGFDSGKITPEHHHLLEKATRAWDNMKAEDIRYISTECTSKIKDLLPKMSKQLYQTFQESSI